MKEIVNKTVNETIYEHTTPNGFKVYIWPYALSEEVYMTLTVKYGSIHTSFKVGKEIINVPNGLAHFLEHVKFNEKKGVTAHETFYKLGSYTNAYTTYDHTSYEVVCRSYIKDNLMELLSFVYNPYFTKELVAKEKPIIIEEAKTVLDNPYNIGYFSLLNNLYENSNYKYLVTGKPQEIKKIKLENIEKVFNAYYHPHNMFLTITGNVNQYEIEKIVDEFFATHPFPKYAKPQNILLKEPDYVIKDKQVIKTNVIKDKLLYALKIPRGLYHKYSDINLRVLFNIILNCNFGKTSYFNEEVIKQKIVDELYYMVTVNKDHIIVTFEISADNITKIIQALEAKLKTLEVSEEDFNRKIKYLIACSILDFEDPTEVNNSIRNDIIVYNEIVNNYADILKKLKYHDINNIIKKLQFEKSMVVLKPNK